MQALEANRNTLIKINIEDEYKEVLNIIKQCEARILELARTASVVMAQYYEKWHEYQSLNPSKGKGRIGIRIRFNKRSVERIPEAPTKCQVEICWVRFVVSTSPNPDTQGKPRHDVYLKKGKGYQYNIAVIEKHAKPWEYDLFYEAEEELAKIRYAISFWSSTRKSAIMRSKKFKQVIEEGYKR